MDNLTERQKIFARGIFEGLTQREAYKKAYNCKGKKDDTIDSLASRLLSNVKVKKFLDELNKEVNKSAILTKEERMIYLSRIVTTPISDVSPDSDLCQEYDRETRKVKMPSKIQAVQELNKMDGAYTPEQVELTGKDGSPLIVQRSEEEMIKFAEVLESVRKKL